MGKPGKGPGEFGEAHMIAVNPKGEIYVADSVNARAREVRQEIIIFPVYVNSRILPGFDKPASRSGGVTIRTFSIGREIERLAHPGSERCPDSDSLSERSPPAGRPPTCHRARASSDKRRL